MRSRELTRANAWVGMRYSSFADLYSALGVLRGRGDAAAALALLSQYTDAFDRHRRSCISPRLNSSPSRTGPRTRSTFSSARWPRAIGINGNRSRRIRASRRALRLWFLGVRIAVASSMGGRCRFSREDKGLRGRDGQPRHAISSNLLRFSTIRLKIGRRASKPSSRVRFPPTPPDQNRRAPLRTPMRSM
jgi:hypothetical protein